MNHFPGFSKVTYLPDTLLKGPLGCSRQMGKYSRGKIRIGQMTETENVGPQRVGPTFNGWRRVWGNPRRDSESPLHVCCRPAHISIHNKTHCFVFYEILPMKNHRNTLLPSSLPTKLQQTFVFIGLKMLL